VTGPSARDEGDLRFSGIWSEVEDLVLLVEGCGWVGEGNGLQSGENEVGWVVDEVFS